MRVIKRSGEREEFDRRKTLAAIQRADVPAQEAEEIVRRIEAQLYEGITTEEIYRRVRLMLQGRKAARFGLKKALLRLGPEGEHFERYVARLFEAEGFRTSLRQIVEGRCVGHEVDVLLEREGTRSMVECKFHNSLGTKCNIQCALYVYARFLDLREGDALESPMLVTNTRFTSDAERYAACVGLRLMGWSYPAGAGLEALATRTLVFPVTMLDMRRSEQLILLAHGFVTVDDVLSRAQDLTALLGQEPSAKLQDQARENLGR